MSSATPTSKFQEHMRQLSRADMKPGPGETYTCHCIIQQVYDPETVEDLGASDEIKNLMSYNPGLIYASVISLPSKKTYLLPFKDTEDHLYSTYGNAALLNGRLGKIEYTNLDISTGRIIVQRTWYQPLLNVRTSTDTYELGGIL